MSATLLESRTDGGPVQCTMSDIVLSVIVGMPSIDLTAAKRVKMYREGKRTEEDDVNQEQSHNRWSRRTREEWQRRWDLADNGRWTHRIIPEVGDWTSRKHGFVTFHLTQVLTGAGCFRSDLKRFGHYRSADCPACSRLNGDVNHALFQCPRFEEERQRFRASWEDLVKMGVYICVMFIKKERDATSVSGCWERRVTVLTALT